MLETAHDLRLSNCKGSTIRVLNSRYKQWFIIMIIILNISFMHGIYTYIP
jgi:hypothetical protein